jgi:Cof subfamily protein (haloacid dehalogenase superfamily)
MGKFDGIMLCTDLDETLLNSDKKVSSEDMASIEYFKENGGLFTFITGRTPLGIPHIIEMAPPNTYIGCLNGGAIYDPLSQTNVMEIELDRKYVGLLEFVESNFPSAGLEVFAHDKVWFCKANELVNKHRRLELLPDNQCDYREVTGKLAKVLIIDEPQVIDEIVKQLPYQPDAENFEFIRSTKNYYEILPKGASKGNLLVRIAEMNGIAIDHTYAAGDNENDISLIKAAGTGYAVANAIDSVKESADRITVSHNESPISHIIRDIETDISQ